jgi:hypothetical protein
MTVPHIWKKIQTTNQVLLSIPGILHLFCTYQSTINQVAAIFSERGAPPPGQIDSARVAASRCSPPPRPVAIFPNPPEMMVNDG